METAPAPDLNGSETSLDTSVEDPSESPSATVGKPLEEQHGLLNYTARPDRNISASSTAQEDARLQQHQVPLDPDSADLRSSRPRFATVDAAQLFSVTETGGTQPRPEVASSTSKTDLQQDPNRSTIRVIESAYRQAPQPPTQTTARSPTGANGPAGRANSQVAKTIFGTAGDYEQLDRGFRKRSKDFFRVGRVFKILWAETAGTKAETVITDVASRKLTRDNRFGELIHTKLRWFAVVRLGGQACTCIRILTYGGRGLSKPGIDKSEHAVVFTGDAEPDLATDERPKPGEPAPRRTIRVVADEPGAKLDPRARLDYGRVYSVEYNVKAKSFGLVHPASEASLLFDFRQVFLQQFSWLPAATTKEDRESSSNEDADTNDGRNFGSSNAMPGRDLFSGLQGVGIAGLGERESGRAAFSSSDLPGGHVAGTAFTLPFGSRLTASRAMQQPVGDSNRAGASHTQQPSASLGLSSAQQASRTLSPASPQHISTSALSLFGVPSIPEINAAAIHILRPYFSARQGAAMALRNTVIARQRAAMQEPNGIPPSATAAYEAAIVTITNHGYSREEAMKELSTVSQARRSKSTAPTYSNQDHDRHGTDLSVETNMIRQTTGSSVSPPPHRRGAEGLPSQLSVPEQVTTLKSTTEDALSELLRRFSRLTRHREQVLSRRIKLDYEFSRLDDCRRFFSEAVDAYMKQQESGDADAVLPPKQEALQVKKDHEVLNEQNQLVSRLGRDLGEREYKLARLEGHFCRKARQVLANLFPERSSSILPTLPSLSGLDRSEQSSDIPTSVTVDPLLQSYFDAQGQVGIYTERLVEHKIDYEEEKGKRNLREDQELPVDPPDHVFEKEYHDQLAQIESDLSRAMVSAENLRQSCLQHGLDPDDTRRTSSGGDESYVTSTISSEISEAPNKDLDELFENWMPKLSEAPQGLHFSLLVDAESEGATEAERSGNPLNPSMDKLKRAKIEGWRDAVEPVLPELSDSSWQKIEGVEYARPHETLTAPAISTFPGYMESPELGDQHGNHPLPDSTVSRAAQVSFKANLDLGRNELNCAQVDHIPAIQPSRRLVRTFSDPELQRQRQESPWNEGHYTFSPPGKGVSQQ